MSNDWQSFGGGGRAVSTTRTVHIPGSDYHAGHFLATVTVLWECPACGGPRGDVARTISYDGSRRLGCDGWSNPCGHIDTYSAVRREAALRAAVPNSRDCQTCGGDGHGFELSESDGSYAQSTARFPVLLTNRDGE
jgi:hypothetical protein